MHPHLCFQKKIVISLILRDVTYIFKKMIGHHNERKKISLENYNLYTTQHFVKNLHYKLIWENKQRVQRNLPSKVT